jgi:hypothetical protein
MLSVSRPSTSIRLASNAYVGCLSLSAVTFLLLGYHPFAEDAGMYICAVKRILHPGLYAAAAPFVDAYVHRTAFPWLLASLVRLSGLPLEWVMFLAQATLLWLLVYSLYRLARLCFHSQSASWISTAIAALALSTPVAGTALSLADPYLTSRSIATPLAVLLLVYVLEERTFPALITLGLLGLVHPLMAGYALFFALVVWMQHELRLKATVILCGSAFLLATMVAAVSSLAPDAPAAAQAALTRTYFFLPEWHWYELAGLLAPLAILFCIYASDSGHFAPCPQRRAALSSACVACGLTVLLISLLYAQPHSASYAIARLQPLRIFHTIYLLMFLLMGGTLAEFLARCTPRWTFHYLALGSVLAAAAFAMLFTARQTFPASTHIEAPWRIPRNPWMQAFLWARQMTPHDALFALDANYITTDGEDAVNFRAVSERSSLSDYSKDGGASAIFPRLAPAWQQGMALSTGLSTLTDAQRVQRLAPQGVGWVILQTRLQVGDSRTRFDCPYANSTVMVCRLPSR